MSNGSPASVGICRYACAAWEHALLARGIDVQLLGGEGVDHEVFTSNYRLVPLDRRSGYRESDDQINRHYWLGIGPGRLIFDPTAHQFDERGGVSLDHFTIGGAPVIATRT